MNDNTAKVLMIAILGATAVGLMFATGSAKAESQPLDVSLISDHPYSSACATRADQLRKKGRAYASPATATQPPPCAGHSTPTATLWRGNTLIQSP